MRTVLSLAAIAAIAFAGPAEAQRRGGDRPEPTITIYDDIEYGGRSLTLDGDAPDLRWVQMNDLTSSIRIEGGQWEVCLEPDYGGTCQVLDENQPNMSAWAFNNRITSIRAIHRPGRDRRTGVTLYEGNDYTGRSVTIVRGSDDLRDVGFNDDANSIRVHSGRWTLCEDAGFGGRCIELSRDSNNLKLFRMDDRLSALGPDGVERPRPVKPGVGYGDGYGADYGAGRLSGGVEGVDATFFARPEYNGYPVAACTDRFGNGCGRPAADLACRAAGMARAVWHAEIPAPYGQAWALGDQTPVNARQVIVDLVCVR
ncbi:hypothetical protein AY599_09385 [Leptolyngbya valderiana BDU 20041]|nr:hypothetical protein AY599_09385 [Leptolyngbya valderiana BDU 20041]